MSATHATRAKIARVTSIDEFSRRHLLHTSTTGPLASREERGQGMTTGAGISNCRDAAVGVLIAVVLARGELGVISWGPNRWGRVWGDRKYCDRAKGLAR